MIDFKPEPQTFPIVVQGTELGKSAFIAACRAGACPMSGANIIDTVLNVGVFVFIGVLFWLYKQPVAESQERQGEDPDGS